eukprot:5357579-Pyramimonas_sp.AAC.1
MKAKTLKVSRQSLMAGNGSQMLSEGSLCSRTAVAKSKKGNSLMKSKVSWRPIRWAKLSIIVSTLLSHELDG